MEKRAVIWDLDGTILDSTNLHYQSWQAILKPYFIDYNWNRFIGNYGRTNQAIIRELFPNVSQQTVQEIADAVSSWFRDHAEGNIVMLPGIVQWLEQFKAWNLSQVIATSSPLLNAQILTGITGISSFFDSLYTAEEMPSKPDPAVFLFAAKSLQVSPENCLVIEDSPQGIQAAHSSGMKSIGVQTSGRTREELKLANWIVEDLTQLDKDVVQNILGID